MARVLVVEDQSAVRFALIVLLRAHGFDVVGVAHPHEAVELVLAGDIAVVLQDMNFERGVTAGDEGIALFRELRVIRPDLPIILMTAWTNLETAVQLTKEGAADYLAKPWNDDRLVALVRMYSKLHAKAVLQPSLDLCGLIYRSDAMHRVVTLAAQVAAEHVPVLILGPNGAGKDKIAEIVQRNSVRFAGPFVRLDAGALPESLLEAELFGAESGAFTGATKTRIGRFEAADGGTLFVDEIGNLSLTGQMKLLRVLQRGELERLGSQVTRKVDVRLISATNVNLYAAVQAGSFREDLLYRINVVELRVPPLAERREDVVPLAQHFLAVFSAERARTPPVLSPAALSSLEAHPWPGNVRELENTIRRALMFAREGQLTPEHLQLPSIATKPPARAARELGADELEAALRKHAGNMRAVAAEFGVSRQVIYRRLEKLGLKLDHFRSPSEGES